jgi:hypothetical protein
MFSVGDSLSHLSLTSAKFGHLLLKPATTNLTYNAPQGHNTLPSAKLRMKKCLRITLTFPTSPTVVSPRLNQGIAGGYINHIQSYNYP